jgi:alpha-1,3-rhamnosyl/mannosyltransferase
LQPRKNIHRVIDAYQSLPAQVRQTHDLVIVGRNGWGSESLVQRLQSVSSSSGVRWLGAVPDLDKRALLQSATALVFPSLSEGFGLPVLEAFASQTPVIASNTTSLPEIATDAALLVDPCDTQAIAHAMQHIANNPSHAAHLSSQGLVRAQHYSWQTCAQQTTAIYQRMLGRSP